MGIAARLQDWQKGADYIGKRKKQDRRQNPQAGGGG